MHLPVDIIMRNILLFLAVSLVLLIFGMIIFTRSYYLKEGRLTALCIASFGIANLIEYIRQMVDISYSYTLHIWGSSLFGLCGLAALTQLLYVQMQKNKDFPIHLTRQAMWFYSPLVGYVIAQYTYAMLFSTPYAIVNGWHVHTSLATTSITVAVVLYDVLLLYVLLIKSSVIAKRKTAFIWGVAAFTIINISLMISYYYLERHVLPEPFVTVLALVGFGVILFNLWHFSAYSPSVTKHYQTLLQLSPSAILIVDDELKVLEVNNIAKKMFSIAKGDNMKTFQNIADYNQLLHTFQKLHKDGKLEKHIMHYENLNTEHAMYLSVEAKIVNVQQRECFFFVIQDVTKEYEQEQYNRYLAYHDTLTGLPNRAHFIEHVVPLLNNITSETGIFMLMDLNSFKYINDTYGHHVGDEVLQHTAHILQETTADGEYIARLGGDEFVMYIPEICELAFKERLTELRAVFATTPYTYMHTRIDIIPSFGYAVADATFRQYEALYQAADEQMYKDKMRMKTEQKMNGH